MRPSRHRPGTAPRHDPVGDRLQEFATEAAGRWDARIDLTRREADAIARAHASGDHWLGNLLEAQAQGRWVEQQVRRAVEDADVDAVFSRLGVDVRTPDGLRYDIMSGTQSNIAAHARREAEELFRMITF